jgi:hypothetical protein
MTRFKLIDVKDLVKGKKYLIIQQMNDKTDTNTLWMNAFQGKFKRFDTKDKLVYFDKLSSVISGNSINFYHSWVKNTALFYEYVKRKDTLQLSMEERSLKDIMRNILGDDTFVHYLFEDACKLELKYEKIQELDEELNQEIKESRKSDFIQLEFTYELFPIDIYETNNLEIHNLEINDLQTNNVQINDFYINDLEPNLEIDNLEIHNLEINDLQINNLEIHNLD